MTNSRTDGIRMTLRVANGAASLLSLTEPAESTEKEFVMDQQDRSNDVGIAQSSCGNRSMEGTSKLVRIHRGLPTGLDAEAS